ncbi:multisubunit sodium/proton antiporter, MrpE subunit [Pelagirhabdus alkalitolerans]|uniref:Multisubunit sodium/proton antiporter, MrpE subunit n=2 Tax=Pelagirhabdus alkalitolerans TaxID=1612202 RepID=A0A1G6H895_9BACI|nr:multisubunit sodium/proton antiporter, MrpE subunit [Pelagirhabdus alkalitolerans]
MFALLLLFWVIIDARLSVETVLVGSVASLAILYLNRDLLFSKEEGGPLTGRFFLNFFSLIGTLVVEIIKSNIQVAKIVLSPKMPIDPGFIKIPVKPKKNVNKVLYGNVITLTPGTLTVDIIGDQYIIHALTKDTIKDLEDSVLEEKILRLEVDEK